MFWLWFWYSLLSSNLEGCYFHKLLRTSEHYVNIRIKELIHRFGNNLLLLRSVIDFFNS